MTQGRPNNFEVENEELRPSGYGRPPRPATEPPGAEASQDSRQFLTDPGSGEAHDRLQSFRNRSSRRERR